MAIATLSTIEKGKPMLTNLLILMLVLGLGFMLGGAYQKARTELHTLELLADLDDDLVMEQASAGHQFYGPTAVPLRRPHLKVITDTGVDAHFDDLVRRNLIESS